MVNIDDNNEDIKEVEEYIDVIDGKVGIEWSDNEVEEVVNEEVITEELKTRHDFW